MNSNFMKTALCNYLRFAKGSKILATEAGRFSSDVLAIRKSELIEFEVKVSKADLKADFKKPKHRLYQAKGLDLNQARHVPTYFYFAVTPEIAEYALQQNLATPYGVVVVFEGKIWKKWRVYQSSSEEADKYIERNKDKIKDVERELIIDRPWQQAQGACYLNFKILEIPPMHERIKVIKRAKKLHQFPVSKEATHDINSRASSELANLKAKYLTAVEKLKELGINIEN